MGRKYFTAEQIIKKLREAEVMQGRGDTVEQICRNLGISDVTYYRCMEACKLSKPEGSKILSRKTHS